MIEVKPVVDRERVDMAAIASEPMHAPPHDLRRHAELVRLATMRLLKSRYRGSSVGVLWSFANPVLMTALYTVIFGAAFASYYGGSTSRYVFSAFVGVVVVTLFMQSTSDAITTVVGNGGLLNKIALDPETFPLAAVAANVSQQAITTFPIILVMAGVLTHDAVRVALVPIVLASIVALCVGFALLLAALYVFFRDLAYLWNVIGFIIWLTCPVFYPAALVPTAVRPWLTLNPVGRGISALREVTLGSGTIDYLLVWSFLILSLLCAVGGYAVFRYLRRDFMDLL